MCRCFAIFDARALFPSLGALVCSLDLIFGFGSRVDESAATPSDVGSITAARPLRALVVKRA